MEKKMYRLKKIRGAISLFAAVTILFLSAVGVFAVDYPKQTNYVADEAGVLSESTIRSIQTTNENLMGDTKTTIGVCTVKTTGDMDIAEYAKNVYTNWKMGDGLLILIASEDKNYYFVPSTTLDKYLTNDDLTTLRNDYLEEDFKSGNIDRGILKTVTKAASMISASFSAAAAESANSAADSPKQTGTNPIVVFFKVILYIVLIAVVLFIALFVAALFNDRAADFMRTYIFRRPRRTQRRVPDYYDDRMYPRERRPQSPQNPAHRPSTTQNRPQSQRGYDRGYDRSYDYYAGSGQPRRTPQSQRSAAKDDPYREDLRYSEYNNTHQGNVYYNADGTVRRAPQNVHQPQGNDYDSTRAFTLPNKNGGNGSYR